MDLILWRHADAAPGGADLARSLTPKGQAQAARMAAWLKARLPADFVLVSSPALRAQQTAQALGAPIVTEPALAPGANVAAFVAGRREPALVLVGHQPDLGLAVARLVCGTQRDWPLDKGAVCWIRDGSLRAALSPELL